MFKVSMSGSKDIDRVLRGLEPKNMKNIMRRAVRLGSKPVKAKAKALAPKKTGKMAKSIRIKRSGKLERFGVYSDFIMLGTREKLDIDSKDPYYYPFAVEYGHSGAPAYPFMRPALESMDGFARSEWPNNLRLAIEARTSALAKKGQKLT